MKENTNIVKYHNDLNSITFYKFGSIDFDLFMALCSKAGSEGKAKVEISFDELRKISGFNTHLSEADFIKSLDSMNGKQLLSNGRIENDQFIDRFILFPKLRIDKKKRVLIAEANEEYLYILNELKKHFTRFELQEFVSLDSKYAKTLYRLLKQFRTTGILKINLDDFRRIMGVPVSYPNKKVLKKVIEPSVEMLHGCFNNLECKTIYERKPGRPVKGYEFTFDPETVPRISTDPEADARIDAGWKKHKEYRKNHPVNSFHNFEQRDYDYDDLERRLLERDN